MEQKLQKPRGEKMFGFQSLKLSLLLTWMLLCAAKTQQNSEKNATVGEDVTLTCESFIESHDESYKTTWIFNNLTKAAAVALYEDGKVHRDAGSKSDRLSVAEKCSLVIKKVTEEDAGRYICRQFKTSGRHVSESTVDLSVTQGKTPSDIRPPPTITTTEAALIGAAVGFSALFITTLMIIRWKKTRGKKTQTRASSELDWSPAGTGSGPGSRQDAADPPEVHYASISHSSISSTRVHGGGHEDDTVTYSTVGGPAAAPPDPSALYATVQKTRNTTT